MIIGSRGAQLEPVAGKLRGAATLCIVRRVIDMAGGLYELLRLGVLTRFRFRGPYWKWRMETAFGTDPAMRPPWTERLHAAVHYGMWIYRMKRGR